MKSIQKIYFISLNKTLPQAWVDYFFNFKISITQLPINQLYRYQQAKELAALLLPYSEIDSFMLLTEIHSQFKYPLLVLDDVFKYEHAIDVLESGADDYLVSSVSPRELHARMNAIARRFQVNANQELSYKQVYEFAHFKLCISSHQLFTNTGEKINLSPSEFLLLQEFVKKPNQILKRDYLAFLIHNKKISEIDSQDRNIDIQISRLRQKIEIDSKKPILIKTIRNQGYLLAGDVVKKN